LLAVTLLMEPKAEVSPHFRHQRANFINGIACGIT
jgi:hypothetical protein